MTGPVPYWRLSGWYFFYFAFVGGFLPYFSLYLTDKGLDPWRLSIVMAMMPLMRTLSPAFWGPLADRLGHKARLARNAMGLATFAFMGFLVADNFWWMVGVMLIMAFFWSAALPLMEALTLGHLRQHVERYGRIRLWGSVGFIVAVQGMGLLLDAWPAAAIVWVSVALLAAAGSVAAVVPEIVAIPAAQHALRLRHALLQPPVIAVMLGGLLMSVAHAPLYTFLSLHLVNHGYSKGAIGALWSLGVCAEIVVFAFMSRLLGAGSLRAVLIGCFLLAALRFVLIGWLPDLMGVVVFAQLLHAASFGAHHAASVTALNRWFAPHQQGTVQSVFGSLSYGAGGIIGGVLCGYSWERYGAGITYTGAAIAALAGAVLIARGLRSVN